MKFNSKPIFLLCIILFFAWIFLSNFFSLPRAIYQEGLEINGSDVSGTQIPITASITDTNITLLDQPQTPIKSGDILLTNNGAVIKSISGNPISIGIGTGLTYSLSDTPTEITFKKLTEYIIFSLDDGEKKSETTVRQYNVNGKIDMSMNLVLSDKPGVDFNPGSKLLFSNGDNVKDNSKNPITIVSGSDSLYKLSGVANPEYNLYNKSIDYMVEVNPVPRSTSA